MEHSELPGKDKLSRTKLRLGMLPRRLHSEGIRGDELQYLLSSPLSPEGDPEGEDVRARKGRQEERRSE